MPSRAKPVVSRRLSSSASATSRLERSRSADNTTRQWRRRTKSVGAAVSATKALRWSP